MSGLARPVAKTATLPGAQARTYATAGQPAGQCADGKSAVARPTPPKTPSCNKVRVKGLCRRLNDTGLETRMM
jgi:hypothetical protein